VGAKWGGLNSVPDAGFFVSNTRWLFDNFATADFRQIWPRHVNRGWDADVGQKFMKSFHSGVICPPKTPNLVGVKQAPHCRAGYIKGCTAERYCLLRVVGPGSFRDLVNCSVQRTVAELRGIKIAQFSDFGLFSLYKTPRNVPFGDLPIQPRGYIAEWFRFFYVVVEVPKGCLPAAKFPATSDRGAMDPKLSQIFAYGKWLYPYKMLLHGASDLDQRYQKTHSFKDGCTVSPNIFAPTPKSPQTPFWEPFNAKPELSVSRTLMELRSWNFKVWYKQVLGGCQNFSARGPSGSAGPPNVNFGPHNIPKTTTARKLKWKTQLHVVKYSLRVQNFFR